MRQLEKQGSLSSIKSPWGGTPTSQLVMSMASYCLDSPAFSTRNRTNSVSDAMGVPEEVMHGTDWWANAVKGAAGVADSQAELFRQSLLKDMEIRCIYHWYPQTPQKGSGYRSIVNGAKMDEALKRACDASGVPPSAVPKDVVMFINPGDVKVQRKGGGGGESVVVVYLKGQAALGGGADARAGGGGMTAEERRAQNPFAQMMAKQLAAASGRRNSGTGS